MKKIITCSVVALLAVAFGTAKADAQNALQKRISSKVNQAVKAKESVPQKAKTVVQTKWLDYNVIMQHKNPEYREEGSAFNVVSCSAVLCDYKDNKNTGVVTVAFDKNCFQNVRTSSDAKSFLFQVQLGKFGTYGKGELEGEPFYFEMEVNKTQKDIDRVFSFTQTQNGAIYLFNMPVRTAAVKKSLKDFFAENGTISKNAAAQAIKNMSKPQWTTQFSAD